MKKYTFNKIVYWTQEIEAKNETEAEKILKEQDYNEAWDFEGFVIKDEEENIIDKNDN